jgi:hypothetical protein
VEGTEEKICQQGFDAKKIKQRDHFEDLGADGRVLKWNLQFPV